MSDEYTPTTQNVRDCYRFAAETPLSNIYRAEREFDRWLAERDARIRAEVIDWFQNFDRWLAAHDREVRAEVIDWIAVTFNDYDVAYGVIDSAREHFGLTKGADRG